MFLHIDKIVEDIVSNKIFISNIHNPSVLSGSFGRLIFLAGVDDLKGEIKFRKKINETINEMIEFVNENRINNNNFDGLTGFFQGINFMFDLGVINSINENEIFREIDDFIISLSEEYLINNNFDLLYGYMGLSNLLILRSEKNNRIRKILSVHVEKLVHSHEGKLRDNYPLELEINITHGLVAIIRFFTNLIENGNKKKVVENFLKYLCNFIISTKVYSRIPDIIKGNDKQYAPLRWCRGDLSAAYALGKAAIVLNDTYIYNETKKVVNKLCKMTDIDKQELTGATICHGSLGVAQ